MASNNPSPLIQNNIIRNNTRSAGDGGGGAGIYLRGANSAQIIGNIIQNNIFPSGDGGGIDLFVGSALIKNNLIIGNTYYSGSGNAISLANTGSGTVIIQNVITGNNSSNNTSVY